MCASIKPGDSFTLGIFLQILMTKYIIIIIIIIIPINIIPEQNDFDVHNNIDVFK